MLHIADTIFIQLLEINNSPWIAIRFPHPNCYMTSCDGCIRFDFLNDTQSNIVIKLLLDLLMPMDWDGCWSMNNYRDCIWFNFDLSWWP